MIRFLIAGLLILPMSPVPRDLDVAVPPGTALEWTNELRMPTPTSYRGAVPTESEGDGDGPGSTRATEVDFGALNPLGVSRITTRDLPAHLPWTVPTTTKGAGNRVPTPSGTITWEYPPTVTPLQWWWCMATVLRAGMHPNLVSDAELINLLYEIGEPSRVAADAAHGQGLCPEILALIKKDVTPVPDKKPDVPEMETPYLNMIARLAVEDLTSDYPYGLNPYFAQRLLSLGEAGFPAVLACARSKHTFLQRNAVAVLGNYQAADGLALLRDLAATSTDVVVRTRAVLSLARRRDKEIVPTLLKWVENKEGNKVRQVLAVHALGLIGATDAAMPILKKAKERINGEFLMTALPALARIPCTDAKFLPDLKALLGSIGSVANESPAPQFVPDIPDPAGTRASILKQMGQLALASHGDEKVAQAVVDRKEWYAINQYLRIEVLSLIGAAGVPVLQSMVLDPMLEPILRARAFVYASIPPDAVFTKKVTRDEGMVPAVRGIGLSFLANIDPAAAREAGRAVIDAYLHGKYQKPAEAYLVNIAVQTVGRPGGLEVESLTDLLSKSLEQRKILTILAKKKKAAEPNQAFENEVEIVIDSPLLESCVIETGRTKSKLAAEMLSALAMDAAVEARAEIMFALGAIGGRNATKALVRALEEKEPWVRWAAATALHSITHRIDFFDWMYGDAAARTDEIRKIREKLGL